jgi:adenosylhomocysteine nucleosidase
MKCVRPVLIGSFLGIVTLVVCGLTEQDTGSRPVVVQGAMPSETEQLVGRLDGAVIENVGGWTFVSGRLDGYPVIVSKTLKGLSNTAAATAVAVERYRPVAIINQGTAGGHDPDLHVYDIVLGKYSVNVGAFKTGYRGLGQGSDFREWRPLDLMASQGSAGQDPNALTVRRFPGDERLLAAAQSVKNRYQRGRVVEGVIATGEIWNSELDRIRWLHAELGTSVEEMETASAAQIAVSFRIPFLGIRVLSNNVTNGEGYDGKTSEACQDFVYQVVSSYVETLRR